MSPLQALILGLIQGLTEFLPVSSSGHLALAQYFMKLPEVPVSFDVLLHLATLIAVIMVLFNQIMKLAKKTIVPLMKGKFREIPNLFWLLIIGSLPAGLLGLLLNDYMETIFSSVRYFSIGFLLTGMLLTVASRLKPGTKDIKDMSVQDSIKMGLFQAVAILPSISRSGSTISGALLSRFNAEDAFTFSFLLSIPAIMGAGLLHADELLNITRAQILPYTIGFTTAFCSGLVSLLIFKKVIVNRRLSIFAYYCLFLSLFIFFFVK